MRKKLSLLKANLKLRTIGIASLAVVAPISAAVGVVRGVNMTHIVETQQKISTDKTLNQGASKQQNQSNFVISGNNVLSSQFRLPLYSATNVTTKAMTRENMSLANWNNPLYSYVDSSSGTEKYYGDDATDQKMEKNYNTFTNQGETLESDATNLAQLIQSTLGLDITDYDELKEGRYGNLTTNNKIDDEKYSKPLSRYQEYDDQGNLIDGTGWSYATGFERTVKTMNDAKEMNWNISNDSLINKYKFTTFNQNSPLKGMEGLKFDWQNFQLSTINQYSKKTKQQQEEFYKQVFNNSNIDGFLNKTLKTNSLQTNLYSNIDVDGIVSWITGMSKENFNGSGFNTFVKNWFKDGVIMATTGAATIIAGIGLLWIPVVGHIVGGIAIAAGAALTLAATVHSGRIHDLLNSSYLKIQDIKWNDDKVANDTIINRPYGSVNYTANMDYTKDTLFSDFDSKKANGWDLTNTNFLRVFKPDTGTTTSSSYTKEQEIWKFLVGENYQESIADKGYDVNDYDKTLNRQLTIIENKAPNTSLLQTVDIDIQNIKQGVYAIMDSSQGGLNSTSGNDAIGEGDKGKDVTAKVDKWLTLKGVSPVNLMYTDNVLRYGSDNEVKDWSQSMRTIGIDQKETIKRTQPQTGGIDENKTITTNNTGDCGSGDFKYAVKYNSGADTGTIDIQVTYSGDKYNKPFVTTIKNVVIKDTYDLISSSSFYQQNTNYLNSPSWYWFIEKTGYLNGKIKDESIYNKFSIKEFLSSFVSGVEASYNGTKIDTVASNMNSLLSGNGSGTKLSFDFKINSKNNTAKLDNSNSLNATSITTDQWYRVVYSDIDESITKDDANKKISQDENKPIKREFKFININNLENGTLKQQFVESLYNADSFEITGTSAIGRLVGGKYQLIGTKDVQDTKFTDTTLNQLIDNNISKPIILNNKDENGEYIKNNSANAETVSSLISATLNSKLDINSKSLQVSVDSNSLGNVVVPKENFKTDSNGLYVLIPVSVTNGYWNKDEYDKTYNTTKKTGANKTNFYAKIYIENELNFKTTQNSNITKQNYSNLLYSDNATLNKTMENNVLKYNANSLSSEIRTAALDFESNKTSKTFKAINFIKNPETNYNLSDEEKETQDKYVDENGNLKPNVSLPNGGTTNDIPPPTQTEQDKVKDEINNDPKYDKYKYYQKVNLSNNKNNNTYYKLNLPFGSEVDKEENWTPWTYMMAKAIKLTNGSTSASGWGYSNDITLYDGLKNGMKFNGTPINELFYLKSSTNNSLSSALEEGVNNGRFVFNFVFYQPYGLSSSMIKTGDNITDDPTQWALLDSLDSMTAQSVVIDGLWNLGASSFDWDTSVIQKKFNLLQNGDNISQQEAINYFKSKSNAQNYLTNTGNKNTTIQSVKDVKVVYNSAKKRNDVEVTVVFNKWYTNDKDSSPGSTQWIDGVEKTFSTKNIDNWNGIAYQTTQIKINDYLNVDNYKTFMEWVQDGSDASKWENVFKTNKTVKASEIWDYKLGKATNGLEVTFGAYINGCIKRTDSVNNTPSLSLKTPVKDSDTDFDVSLSLKGFKITNVKFDNYIASNGTLQNNYNYTQAITFSFWAQDIKNSGLVNGNASQKLIYTENSFVNSLINSLDNNTYRSEWNRLRSLNANEFKNEFTSFSNEKAIDMILMLIDKNYIPEGDSITEIRNSIGYSINVTSSGGVSINIESSTNKYYYQGSINLTVGNYFKQPITNSINFDDLTSDGIANFDYSKTTTYQQYFEVLFNPNSSYNDKQTAVNSIQKYMDNSNENTFNILSSMLSAMGITTLNGIDFNTINDFNGTVNLKIDSNGLIYLTIDNISFNYYNSSQTINYVNLSSSSIQLINSTPTFSQTNNSINQNKQTDYTTTIIALVLTGFGLISFAGVAIMLHRYKNKNKKNLVVVQKTKKDKNAKNDYDEEEFSF